MGIDFTKSPLGTKVETVYGPGEIAKIDSLHPYSVVVNIGRNKSMIHRYRADGRVCGAHLRPTLFLADGFQWPTQEQPAAPVDWSKVVLDTPIWVKPDGLTAVKRHFSIYLDGNVRFWPNGKTSHTAGDGVATGEVPCLYCSLVEPTPPPATAKPEEAERPTPPIDKRHRVVLSNGTEMHLEEFNERLRISYVYIEDGHKYDSHICEINENGLLIRESDVCEIVTGLSGLKSPANEDDPYGMPR